MGPTTADATVTALEKVLAEAALNRGLHLDTSKAAHVGQRDAAHPREDEARKDVDLRKSAGDAPDERVSKSKIRSVTPPASCSISDEDEHQDRHQRKDPARRTSAARSGADRDIVHQHIQAAGRDGQRQPARRRKRRQSRQGTVVLRLSGRGAREGRRSGRVRRVVPRRRPRRCVRSRACKAWTADSVVAKSSP
ncbi:MAG: hypothetical protein MZV64_16810 [Ignavibacteriales bacterium]|nr:hypothetical protein [Ignavibacteriales bacterium]